MREKFSPNPSELDQDWSFSHMENKAENKEDVDEKSLEKSGDLSAYSTEIENTQFLGELVEIVKKHGGIQGSQEFFTPEMARDVMTRYWMDEGPATDIPRTHGLRDSAIRLKKARDSAIRLRKAVDLQKAKVTPKKNLALESEQGSGDDKIENLYKDKVREYYTPDEIVSKHFLYKDTVPEKGEEFEKWARDEQGNLKDSIRNYANELGSTFSESENADKLEKLQKSVQNYYNSAMEQLHLDSSKFGESTTWVWWDLAKQKFLSKHPEKSNSNYLLADPMQYETSQDSEKVVQQIADRHIGWEVVGYAKHGMTDELSLDSTHESYNQIMDLLSEAVNTDNSGGLPSYKLSQLGKLMRENRGISDINFKQL